MSIINQFIEKLGKDAVLTGEDLKARYIHIWSMDEPLVAKALLLPRSTQDVSEIMKICHEYHQPVSIHGGLTNLVGSTETSKDEIVISIEKLNQIEEVDEAGRTMTVQAGVILEAIQEASKEKGLLFPLNFGAKGSAQIGGIIATNAGGLRVVKYGVTRNLILGLEAVLADGTIISSMKKVIKDNSGYDLKQLFIGTEGTLGIVTCAVVKLSEAPLSRTSAFVGINDYNDVVQFLKFVDGKMAGTLSGFELIWKHTYQAMTSPPSPVGPPLPYDFEYYILLESLGADQVRDQKTVEDILTQAVESEMIEDAAVANSAADLEWFWTIREDVHVLVSQLNNDQHFDISLPIPLIATIVERIVSNLNKLEGVERVFSFGHVADGNIHLIVGKSYQSEELKHQINEIVYSELEDIGGSISAEHGIGVHKKNYLHYSRTPEEMTLMRTLKKALDPKCILNLGKVIDI